MPSNLEFACALEDIKAERGILPVWFGTQAPTLDDYTAAFRALEERERTPTVVAHRITSREDIGYSPLSGHQSRNRITSICGASYYPGPHKERDAITGVNSFVSY